MKGVRDQVGWCEGLEGTPSLQGVVPLTMLAEGWVATDLLLHLFKTDACTCSCVNSAVVVHLASIC